MNERYGNRRRQDHDVRAMAHGEPATIQFAGRDRRIDTGRPQGPVQGQGLAGAE